MLDKRTTVEAFYILSFQQPKLKLAPASEHKQRLLVASSLLGRWTGDLESVAFATCLLLNCRCSASWRSRFLTSGYVFSQVYRSMSLTPSIFMALLAYHFPFFEPDANTSNGLTALVRIGMLALRVVRQICVSLLLGYIPCYLFVINSSGTRVGGCYWVSPN